MLESKTDSNNPPQPETGTRRSGKGPRPFRWTSLVPWFLVLVILGTQLALVVLVFLQWQFLQVTSKEIHKALQSVKTAHERVADADQGAEDSEKLKSHAELSESFQELKMAIDKLREKVKHLESQSAAAKTNQATTSDQKNPEAVKKPDTVKKHPK